MQRMFDSQAYHNHVCHVKNVSKSGGKRNFTQSDSSRPRTRSRRKTEQYEEHQSEEEMAFANKSGQREAGMMFWQSCKDFFNLDFMLGLTEPTIIYQ